MINTITGELKIFTKEVETAKGKRVIFNACVGATKVNDDGEYLNYYMPVNFATALREDIGKVYTNKSFDIVNIEAWIKAYKGRDGLTHPVLFINKCTVITDGESKKASKKTSKKILKPIQDDSLPF